MAVLSFSTVRAKPPVFVLPRALIEPTMARKIRAQIRPYSMAVAPSSSRRTRLADALGVREQTGE